jgi:hypothetical protein
VDVTVCLHQLQDGPGTAAVAAAMHALLLLMLLPYLY